MEETLPDGGLRAELHRVFGARAFVPAMYYANAPALRFELSRDGHHIDLFTQAYDRAREIVEVVFAGSQTVRAVLLSLDGEPLLRRLDEFRSIRRCGVRLRRPRALWREGDGEDQKTCVAFPVPVAELHRLLWGALAGDLGVRPMIPALVYLADPERGVVVHPYDDRGMDVAGPNHALLRALYERFNGYLLDYDRARMDEFFA